MANEITVNSGINIQKGNLSFQLPLNTITADLTGTRVIRNVQNVGTTFEALAVNDVATAGWAYFRNLSTTNFVEIGVEVSATFYPLIRLNAGETAGPIRLSVLTARLRANTAAVDVDCLIAEA
jgi:hypothetical protein